MFFAEPKMHLDSEVYLANGGTFFLTDKHWQVVNAPTHTAWMRNQSQTNCVKRCYQWAHKADAKAILIINGRVPITGEGAFYKFLWEIEGEHQAGKAYKEGVPIDVIGIQIHERLGARLAPAKLLRLLDQYAKFGLPIHMTHLALPSDRRPIRSSWKQGVWTEREQADYAAILYTTCFSHPSVEAITWSVFSDQGDLQEGLGLLRSELYTKRIYKILRKLIHTDWQTRGNGRSDAKGDFRFRGFYGRYRVTVIPPNNVPYITTIHLTRGRRRDFDITVT